MSPQTPKEPELSKTKSKVNERSTKGEIWQAYNQLAENIEQEEVKPESKSQQSVYQTLDNLGEIKVRVSESLDNINNQVLKDFDELNRLRNNLAQEKRAMFLKLTEQKTTLENEIQEVEKKWNELKFQKSSEREREEEAYQYQLSLKRRDENDEFTREKLAKEKAISEREKAIDNREKEISLMEKDLTQIETKIGQAVKETQTKLTQELSVKHQTEVKEIKLAHENQLSIANLKITNLENLNKSQVAEIENLKRQLVENNRQLKEIAVSVISGRSKELETSAEGKE